jgi:hypothetical protein
MLPPGNGTVIDSFSLYPYFQESKSRFQRLSIMKIGNGMIKKGSFAQHIERITKIGRIEPFCKKEDL